MITVPHSEEHDRRVGMIPGAETVGVGQTGHGLRRLVELSRSKAPAGHPATLLHEREVIERFHLVLLGGEGLDDSAAGIIAQQHGMGQLDGGVLPHGHPGRDAGEDYSFRGPDRSAGAGLVIILLQIYHAHQASAHPAVV